MWGKRAAPTAHLDTAKLLFNSVLLRKKARFLKLDIENFYLETPMTNYEYMKINIRDILQEVIDEYNLLDYVHNGWVYVEIRRGAYGLPQAGKLSNDLLATRLESAGYVQAKTTPGLWSHKTRPIRFCLIVDDS